MLNISRNLTLTLALCAAPVFAQDGQLYETPSDPDASFVRIVSPGDTLAVVATNTFDAVQGGVTPYVTMPAGMVTVSVGDLAGKEEILAASFYTFITGTDGALHMVKDTISNSPAKADLVIYNLSDLPQIDLYVPSVDAVALAGITQNTSHDVTLKAPLTLDFEIRDGASTLATLPAIAMQRRAGVTVVFSGADGDYTAFSTENLYIN
ncbi:MULTISPECIES: alginate O-acetyltransferase AlgF [unclassified Yoonia]|uniref:alginate O-acetyltransferase AlgF n=1 Tax=unclassified Yoonia TaxID=2629118 RepID=UPI002AFE99FC|nr:MULTISPECIES: alginate O-acetyltransferase AlgF [unclassified Yoonia]